MRFFLFVYDKFRGAIRTNYFHYRLRNVIFLTITVIMLNISQPRHWCAVYFFCVVRRRARIYLCQYNIVVHVRCTSLYQQQTVVQVVPCAVAVDKTRLSACTIWSVDVVVVDIKNHYWYLKKLFERLRPVDDGRLCNYIISILHWPLYIYIYVRATNIQFYRLCFRYIYTETHTFIYSKIY